jgi:ribulose-phosphate 3-epimerase
MTVKIAPSILSADFSQLAEEIKKVEEGADLLHLDIMDGHFVPNITVGPGVVKSLRRRTSLPFDVHLMIENPQEYIEQFTRAGSDLLTVHQEACPRLKEIIQKIREQKIKVGVSLNPSTPLSKITDVLEEVDVVLLMTVNPGFGGQKFIPAVLPKIEALRKLIEKRGIDIEIEVDGGINSQTARQAIKAGADILVIGSALFREKDPLKTLQSIKNNL